MLPTSFFDRMTHAMGLRTDRRGTERRRSTRIPASFRAEVYPISGGALGAAAKVRVRDISTSGVGILVPQAMGKTAEVVIALQASGSEELFVLHCRARRTTKLDGTWAAMGLSFEGLLAPGQIVAVNLTMDSLYWIDVAGEKIPDDAELAA